MQEQPGPITTEVVAQTSKLLNLPLSAERVEEVAPQVAFFLGLFAALDHLDLREEEPVVVFNAEWR
jgi:hypothetical protein